MADDLDDEWWLEDNAHKKKSQSSSSHDESEDDEPQPDDGEAAASEAADSEDSSEEKSKTTKRKADTDNEESSPKKKKKKKSRKRITDELKKKKKQNGTNEDLIQLMQKHYKDKLSTVEWDEVKLDKDFDGQAIMFGIMLQALRLYKHFFLSSDTDHTPASYLRTVLPKWKKMLSSEINVGSPLLLLVTSSAIRAVQLNREIADFKGDSCKTAKLFAKHFKVQEQQKFLAKKVCHVGLGTPNRLRTLLKTDSLHLDNVSAIVLDWNWRDVKSKRLCDILDIKKELMELLKDYLVPHVQKTKCKLGLL